MGRGNKQKGAIRRDNETTETGDNLLIGEQNIKRGQGE